MSLLASQRTQIRHICMEIDTALRCLAVHLHFAEPANRSALR